MNNKRENLTYLLLTIPSILVFSLVMVVPFIQGFYYSFTDWGEIYNVVNFTGIGNYLEIFSDESFWYAFVLTFIFSFLSIILINIVALGLATLVTRKIRGVGFFRAGFFLPNLIGGLILGYIWQFLFNSVIYELLGSSPLSNPTSALFALVCVLTWQYAGYIMIIYVTAILNIPEDVIEASEIDGASKLKQWTFVKIPMLVSAFTITLFLTLTNSFKQFDVIFSLTNGGPSRELADGSIVNGTSTLAFDIYSRAFQSKDLAQAQAEAIIFFVVLGVISVVQVALTKRAEVEA